MSVDHLSADETDCDCEISPYALFLGRTQKLLFMVYSPFVEQISSNTTVDTVERIAYEDQLLHEIYTVPYILYSSPDDSVL